MHDLGLNRFSPLRLAIAALLFILVISTLSLIGKARQGMYLPGRGGVLHNMHFADKLPPKLGIPGFLSDDRAGVESLAGGSGPSNDSQMNAIAEPPYTSENYLEQWYGDRWDQGETSNT